MKKTQFFVSATFSLFLLTSSLISCVSTKNLAEGEELVEYKKTDYKIENKNNLTQTELREDCDMLKYIIYNVYAGIDEATSLGFDLDATIEEIYNKTLEKKNAFNELYPTSEFSSIITTTMAKNLTNSDQHVYIAGNVKDSVCLFYSNIYFEKKDGKYYVYKSDNEKILIGDEYTGSENNLYPIINTDEEVDKNEIIYRYAVMTKKKIKSSPLSVNGSPINVSVKTDTPIPVQYSWTGVCSTDSTLYMSLGDCSMVYGLTNQTDEFSYSWDKFIKEIAKQADGKSNIIFDLRSNPGGYKQFPAKILASAYYYKHIEDENFYNNIVAKLINDTSIDCTLLVSPFIMQTYKECYTDYFSNEYERFTPEVKEFFETYWKKMKSIPIRKHISLKQYACDFEEYPEPDFKGNVYLLINQGSASAAEFGTEMTFLLRDKGINVTVVGENSWGGVKYAGMFGYYLPHSGLYVRLGNDYGESPFLQSIPNWKGEGFGFYPDYWATNNIILQTLVNLTGDDELSETLQDLGKRQY